MNPVTLDGTTNGAITISTGSTFTANVARTFVLGTINNQGNILNGFQLIANTRLQGMGTVTLNGCCGGITQSGGIFTLENVDNTIQGVGNIDLVGLVNDPSGVVNANVNSIVQTLLLSNGPITNVGLLEATNGGMLQLQNTTVINTGGNITANGGTVELSNPTVIVGGNITANNGGIVQLDGADIQGATLNTLNGGVLETSPFGLNPVTLDGATNGAITISGGSTYTANFGTTTFVLGTINNQGNIQLNGGGRVITLQPTSNVTLQGGGTVTLNSAAGVASIGTFGDIFTLENVDNTIQGAGNINSLLVNDGGGTILANVNGGVLSLDSTGVLTNNGVLEAKAGGTLVAFSGLANFSGDTLTGGTYIVDGTSAASTMALSLFSNTGGEIVNNAANIILNGANANVSFIDANGNQLLSALAANTTALSGLTIENGYNLTTPGDFSNAGTMTVGNASTFQVGAGGVNAYTQSGGTTQGTGTITALVSINGGTIIAGVPGIPGTLNVTGNYSQTGGGVYSELISSTANGLLNVSGLANLGAGGTLTITLLGGFDPANGTNFTIVDYGSQSGTFTISDALFGPGNSQQWVISSYHGGDGDDIVLTAQPAAVVPTPEPSSLMLLSTGMVALFALAIRRKREAS